MIVSEARVQREEKGMNAKKTGKEVMIVETCEACEQFKNRVKEWNYWCCAIDPLPYINDMIKPHKHLIFEGRRSDGAGDYVLVFHCLNCAWWWKLSAKPAFGCLNALPYLPKSHL
jgi:hypothetical protein